MTIGQGVNYSAPVTSTLNAFLTDSDGVMILCSCTGAPPATAGFFAHGALAIRSDSGTGTNAIYQNVGSTAVPSWQVMDTSGTSLVLPEASTDGSTTTGTSLDLTQSLVTSGNGLRQTLAGLTTGVGHSIVHATSVIASGGSLMRISSTGVDTSTTTGTLLDLASTVGVAATQFLQTYGTTTGIGESMVVNALTTGQGQTISSSATAITTTGRLFLSNHSGATSTSGTINEFVSSANDETILLKLTAASLTTGNVLDVTGQNALTSGKGIAVSSSATAITGAGRLFSSVHSGNAGVSAILNEFSSAAADETVIAQVTASAALVAGTAFNVSAVAMTTGTAISAGDLNALTDGKGIHIASSATAISSTGRLFHSNHTGNAGVSAVLNEFASAAADETVIAQVTASGLLAAGKALNVSVAAMTTGDAVSVANGDALTTGRLAHFKSNSADATARSLVTIHNDHASAVGALCATMTQDAPTSTNFFPILKLNGFTLWAGNGNTPNTALSGTAGDWLIGGDSGKGYFCTGTTNWTAFA